MRLRSVTVRQYRIHRELRIELDPSRTLIGGPNESGKSTLAEAAHRALFLKAKGNTELHRAMVSTLHQGHPEVELHFEAGGAAYQLKKRFGPSGTVTLTSSGAAPLAGDLAEAELARLLGVEAGAAGKTAAAQWSHLWAWQGRNGDDPTEHANAQQAGLLQQLGQVGGAVAMQSDFDAAVAASFSAAADAAYVQSGKSRAGSDLEKAETADAEAQEGSRLAGERLERSLQSVRDFEAAAKALERADAVARNLDGQKTELDRKLLRVDELRRRESAHAAEAKAAADRHAALDAAHARIGALRATLREAEAALAPQNSETARLSTLRVGAEERRDTADRDGQAAADHARAARLRRDLAFAWLNRFEKAARLEELATKAGQIAVLEDELRTWRENLARLPALAGAELKRLQKLESARIQAEAALQAASAEVEVLSASGPFLAGDSLLGAGEKRTLTEETELTFGTLLKLRIRPGGGATLAEARKKAQEARQAFVQGLDAHGLPSLADAAEVVSRRSEISARVEAAEAALNGLSPKKVAAALDEARADALAAEAEVARRADPVAPSSVPETPAAARHLLGVEERHLEEREAAEDRLKAVRQTAAQEFAAVDGALKRHVQALEKKTRELETHGIQLRLLMEAQGDDDSRTSALAAAAREKAAAEMQLGETRKALADLQPDLLAADAERLQRALLENARSGREAETRRAVVQAALRSDGAEDPEAAATLAAARALAARGHLVGVRRKAEAIRLLDRLFRSEQQAMAERYTAPLVDRIGGYLQCLFGPGARARLALAENSFQGLQLVRPADAGGALPFETLSGGAREQVAAAVRLAMAEVLSAGHGGSLPVVFDDAFAHSDPERVQTLQRMLDLAASRGLQVIVLTCAPSDYAALGAREIILRAERAGLPREPEIKAGLGASPAPPAGRLGRAE